MNEKHIKKIIDKQFKIANLDLKYEDVSENKMPNWFTKHTYSKEDNEKWKQWTMKYMRDKLKYTKDKAVIQTAWFDMQFGLKVKKDTKAKNV
jgi:hypothetical protein